MKYVKTKHLNIAYNEFGDDNSDSCCILLHGFPYCADGLTDVAMRVSEAGIKCYVPSLRGYGETTFLDDRTPRSGQQAALAHDLIEFMDALSIQNVILGGYDWGGRAACIVSALYPERVEGLVSCGLGYNIQNIPAAKQPLPATQEIHNWYVYYFNTERGCNALKNQTAELFKYLWSSWSPNWHFTEELFDISMRSFKNPDFVDIVIHSYRHRLGEIKGAVEYEQTEKLLSSTPKILVPTVILYGEEDSVNPPELSYNDDKLFSHIVKQKVLKGIGHNIPEESPDIFMDAILTFR